MVIGLAEFGIEAIILGIITIIKVISITEVAEVLEAVADFMVVADIDDNVSNTIGMFHIHHRLCVEKPIWPVQCF